MTVHVHSMLPGITIGSHSHQRPEDRDPSIYRTWSFDCSEMIDGERCETRVLRDIEFTSPVADNVPLSETEKLRAERLREQSNEHMANLAMGLGEIIKQQAAAGQHAPVGV
jgi:hypothetical protein